MHWVHLSARLREDWAHASYLCRGPRHPWLGGLHPLHSQGAAAGVGGREGREQRSEAVVPAGALEIAESTGAAGPLHSAGCSTARSTLNCTHNPATTGIKLVSLHGLLWLQHLASCRVDSTGDGGKGVGHIAWTAVWEQHASHMPCGACASDHWHLWYVCTDSAWHSAADPHLQAWAQGNPHAHAPCATTPLAADAATWLAMHGTHSSCQSICAHACLQRQPDTTGGVAARPTSRTGGGRMATARVPMHLHWRQCLA